MRWRTQSESNSKWWLEKWRKRKNLSAGGGGKSTPENRSGCLLLYKRDCRAPGDSFLVLAICLKSKSPRKWPISLFVHSEDCVYERLNGM